MHRLQSLVDVTVAQDLRERAQLLGLVEGLHRHVGMVPVAHHAESLEVDALGFDLRQRVLATRLAEFAWAERLHFLAARLLDLMLDRQAVAVPAGHVRRVVAVERARLDDDVLQHLVDRVTEMNRAVRVRRTVVKNVRRAAARDLAELVVDALLLPELLHVRLATREVRLHREGGLGQVEGLLVVHGHT